MIFRNKCLVLLLAFAVALSISASAQEDKTYYSGSLLGGGDEAVTKKPLIRFADAIADIVPKTVSSKGSNDSADGTDAPEQIDSLDALEKSVTRLLEEYAAGNASARAALGDAARRTLNLPENELKNATRSPALRTLVTANIMSESEQTEETVAPARSRAWSRALDAAGEIAPAETLRLALLGYQQDEFVSCMRRLQKVPADNPLAVWITARLLLHEGRLAEACDLLARVVEKNALKTKMTAQAGDSDFDVPPVAPWRYERDLIISENGADLASRIVAEYGVLSLARQNYAEALDCFLRCELEDDAAYVAEYVMTSAELQKYVDAVWPNAGENAETISEAGTRIRHILAKRFMRERRWQDARPYFPKTVLDAYDQYVADVQQAYNESLSANLRAAGFWLAAANVRDNGRALFAAEAGPNRTAEGWKDVPVPQPARLHENALVPVSPDEAERVASRTITKEDRDHRYRAAELATYAAALLPNDDIRTARILATAGVWLKNRDPRAAEPFYKMLAIRCPGTELAKSANKLHWFPPEITGTVVGVWPDAPRVPKPAPAVDAAAQPTNMQ